MNRIISDGVPHSSGTVHPITDEALMHRYATTGEHAAFDSLYRRYRGSLLRYLHRHTGSPAAGDELYQDVWLAIVRTRESYRPSASFRSWLFTLAHNRLVDHYRSQARVHAVIAVPRAGAPLPDAPAPESSTPHAAGEQRELAARLLQLITSLPQEQRDAFLLKEEGGFTLEEIAGITGAGAETVKSRLRYALAKLRDGLEAIHGS